MTWAFKRQILYAAILLVLIFVLGYFFVYPKFQRPASCTDGRENGTETGVDCGGSCVNACATDADPISVLWSRIFRVVPGRYNAIAYIENHNPTYAVDKINYRFRFADANNIYIGKREGTTYIPPAGRFPRRPFF